MKASKKLVAAIVEHLLSGKGEPFTWDDGDDRDITIEIEDEDLADIEKAIEAWSKSLPSTAGPVPVRGL